MLMLAPTTSLVIGVYLLQQGQGGGALTLFLCAAATASLTAAVTIPCRYTLHDDALTVRCGLLCYQIPLAQITSVTKSATILSGPALSMKRGSHQNVQTNAHSLAKAAGIIHPKPGANAPRY